MSSPQKQKDRENEEKENIENQLCLKFQFLLLKFLRIKDESPDKKTKLI